MSTYKRPIPLIINHVLKSNVLFYKVSIHPQILLTSTTTRQKRRKRFATSRLFATFAKHEQQNADL